MGDGYAASYESLREILGGTRVPMTSRQPCFKFFFVQISVGQ